LPAFYLGPTPVYYDPVPEIYKDLAVRYMPRIWVHPESRQPIDFDDYLAKSRLVRQSDRKVLIAAPSVRDMIALDYNDMHATDWNAMVNFMRKRLATAISNQYDGP